MQRLFRRIVVTITIITTITASNGFLRRSIPGRVMPRGAEIPIGARGASRLDYIYWRDRDVRTAAVLIAG